MSSEEKASNPDPNDQSDSHVEPVEAELADSMPLEPLAEAPLAETVPDLNDQEPVDAFVVEGPLADANTDIAEGEKSQITNFFKESSVAGENGGVALAPGVGKIAIKPSTPPPLASHLQNLSANGGAVGALVLGVWCFLGSFITNWSIINGMLGLLLGAWGLTSRKKKWAWIGIVLCTIGILLCMAEFSELINKWMYEVDDTVG